MSVQSLIDQEAMSVRNGHKYNTKRCTEIGQILVSQRVKELEHTFLIKIDEKEYLIRSDDIIPKHHKDGSEEKRDVAVDGQ